jgi:hypothetical protein
VEVIFGNYQFQCCLNTIACLTNGLKVVCAKHKNSPTMVVRRTLAGSEREPFN